MRPSLKYSISEPKILHELFLPYGTRIKLGLGILGPILVKTSLSNGETESTEYYQNKPAQDENQLDLADGCLMIHQA